MKTVSTVDLRATNWFAITGGCKAGCSCPPYSDIDPKRRGRTTQGLQLAQDTLVLFLVARPSYDGSSSLSQAQCNAAANAGVTAGDHRDVPAQVKQVC